MAKRRVLCSSTLHILMSSGAPTTVASPSLEERLLGAEARAAAAETKVERLTYRLVHLTASFDAQAKEIAALRAAAAAASPPPPK